jgi:gliding motility-associated lipoprotein GldH
MNKFVFLNTFLSLYLIGCGNAIYEKSHKIPNNIWLYNQNVSFNFEINDTSQLYDIVLYVSHNADFEYQNFYTLLKVDAPAQEKSRIDTISIELSDAVGAWHGKCSGNYCETPITFISQTAFAKTGKYTLQFEQFSRQDSLSGIQSLRLVVLKNDLQKTTVQK